MERTHVTILGAGLMGTGLAQVFAAEKGTTVTVRSRKLKDDPARDITNNLQLLVSKGALSDVQARGILSRITFTDDLEASLTNADFVVESVLEDMELKQSLFRDIEPYVRKDTILATNTSVMSITEIASKSLHRERIVGTHFWNPPYLIPLVEVVKGDDTSLDTMDKTYDYLKRIGKRPVKCMKDVPGFIANRLQHAIWREALSLVENGIADPATVDESLRYGPGLRWPTLGILENADMIGLDLSLSIQSYVLPFLEDSHEPSRLLQELVEKGDLGFKTGKGYQSWSQEEADASRKRLQEYLIEVSKNLT